MSGRRAKMERRNGTRRRKPYEFVPVDDPTNYSFNAELYRDRRSHTTTAPITETGYRIIGYLAVEKGKPEIHSPKEFWESPETAAKHVPKLKLKSYDIRAVIHKPLRGVPTPPSRYEVVIDDQGEPVRIPAGHR